MMKTSDMEYTNELNVVKAATGAPVSICYARYEAAMMAIHEVVHVAKYEDGETGRRARKILSVLEQVGLVENGVVGDLKKAA